MTTSPEQDYLTRYFWHTPHWTHIDVSYNFQLHHLALKLADKDQSDPRRQLPYEDVADPPLLSAPKAFPEAGGGVRHGVCGEDGGAL